MTIESMFQPIWVLFLQFSLNNHSFLKSFSYFLWTRQQQPLLPLLGGNVVQLSLLCLVSYKSSVIVSMFLYKKELL